MPGFDRSNIMWCSPPANLTLQETEVHVWLASLNARDSDIRKRRHTLSLEENARAERFKFEEDRFRYIVRHRALRSILSLYTNIPPKQLKFFDGSHGKPEVTLSSDQSALQFNLSRSRDIALIAVSRGRQIGVDVEYIQKNFEWNEIVERFFSPREITTIRAFPPKLRLEAFFRCWTRKEAYIKARGQGLSIPLNQFDISVVPGEPPRLAFPNNDAPDNTEWFFQELVPCTDYVAALAVEGDNCGLKTWEWTDSGG